MESIEIRIFITVLVIYMAIIGILTMNDKHVDAIKLLFAFALFCLLFAVALIFTV